MLAGFIPGATAQPLHVEMHADQAHQGCPRLVGAISCGAVASGRPGAFYKVCHTTTIECCEYPRCFLLGSVTARYIHFRVSVPSLINDLLPQSS